MKKSAYLLAFSALIAFNSNAENSPISVNITAGNHPNNGYVVVTSETDSITITDVILNRGNCEIYESGVQPISSKTLSFGKFQKYLYFPSSCNIREISVNTNQGNWKFSIR